MALQQPAEDEPEASTSHPNHLKWLERRANATRQTFLEHIRDTEVSVFALRQRVREFLKRFFEEEHDRAQAVVRATDRILATLRNLPSLENSVIFDVGMANQHMVLAMSAIQVGAIRDGLKAFGQGAEALQRFNEVKTMRLDAAAKIGEGLVSVHRLSTANLVATLTTLSVFKQEELDVGWKDLFQDVSGIVRAIPASPDERIKRASLLITTVLSELGQELLKEVSFLMKIPEWWKKLKKILGLRQRDMSEDLTGAIMKLEERLLAEQEAYENLQAFTKSAVEKFKRLSVFEHG